MRPERSEPENGAAPASLHGESGPRFTSGTLRCVKSRVFWFGVAALCTVGVASVDVSRDGLAIGTRARGSVSVLMTLDELVGFADSVVVATPVDRTSRWENLPTGKRIVTYTRLSIDETILGTPKSEVVVRTLGGAVDNIGQSVSGEAQLVKDQRALVFLSEIDDGNGGTATIVTGMAQGHFPLDETGAAPKLKPSPDRGGLLPRRGPSMPAADVLVGQSLSDARARIVESGDRLGKKRSK